MSDALTAVPTELVIGATLAWEKDLDDFPADEWTITYYFRGAGSGFDVVGSADGATHVFSAASSVTAGMTAGRYDYQAVAVNGSEKHLVDEGTLTAKASLAAIDSGTAYDGRSPAKKILDAIDSLMQGKATLDQQKYLIESGVPGFASRREAERIDPEKLLALRKYYASIVSAENRRRRRQSFRTVRIQFDEPS